MPDLLHIHDVSPSRNELPPTTAHDGQMPAVVFNIQHFCLHDGPGIRTTVFMSGCGLKCLWCCNPESQRPAPQIAIDRTRCTACGDCVPVCPESAISRDRYAKVVIDRHACTSCGACIDICEPDALSLYGKTRTPDEVFTEVLKDKRWYGERGGITVSGGEPLTHPTFVTRLLSLCRDAGIHTCIETCGQVKTDVVADVLKFTDFVLFDLKHMNSESHHTLTGRHNHLILDNARLVAQSGVDMQFRMPLIPGLNSNPDNLAATARFLREQQGDDASIELMPYHTLAKDKYDALDIPYRLADLPAAGADFVHSVQQTFTERGVKCTVSQ